MRRFLLWLRPVGYKGWPDTPTASARRCGGGAIVLDGFQHPCKPSLWVYALELACLVQSISDGNWVMVMPALANGRGKSRAFGIPVPAAYRRYTQLSWPKLTCRYVKACGTPVTMKASVIFDPTRMESPHFVTAWLSFVLQAAGWFRLSKPHPAFGFRPAPCPGP